MISTYYNKISSASLEAQDHNNPLVFKATKPPVKLLHVMMLADIIHQSILVARAKGSIAASSRLDQPTFSLAHSQPDPTEHDQDQSDNPDFVRQVNFITAAIVAAPKRSRCATIARDPTSVDKDAVLIAPSTFGAVLASVHPATANTRKLSSKLRADAQAQVDAEKRAYISACVAEWFDYQEHGRLIEYGPVSVRQVGCSVAGEWDPESEYKDEGDWSLVVFAGHLARPALLYAAGDSRAVSEMTPVTVSEGEDEDEDEEVEWDSEEDEEEMEVC